ncbi:MAG: TatD family hydrolase [Elusimicrobiales bacterium]|nr:TatD family hydrolase [Elusimicrobiales bacterium]
MKYFDAHNHLQSYPSDSEGDAAMAAAEAAGVEGMLVCGTSPADWGTVLELSLRYPGITPCFGLHPWFAAEEGWLDRLEEFLSRAPSCVGEIGLDGLKGLPGHEENFAAQLALAKKLKRPAVIHCVKSWGKLPELLRAARPPAFMLHAYGGAPEQTAELAALGAYFSFGPELADPKREKLRAALVAVPRGRLLLESEAPEKNVPGRPAGPAAVAAAAEAAADLLGLSEDELAGLTLGNAENFIREIQ